jgi:hypothetical protein
MFSGNEIVLTVEREGKNFDLSVNEILWTNMMCAA